MIPRYTRPQMADIWSPQSKYRIWFEIEAHATQKLGEMGVVPASAGKALWDWWATNPTIDVEAIDAIEAVTKHDVIAFHAWWFILRRWLTRWRARAVLINHAVQLYLYLYAVRCKLL